MTVKTVKHPRYESNSEVCWTCERLGRPLDQSKRHMGEDDLPVCVCSHMLTVHNDNGCMDCGCEAEWGEEVEA